MTEPPIPTAVAKTEPTGGQHVAPITARRTIDAPIGKVFDTVAHIKNFSEAIPHITRVEFLTDHHRGVGARFRETRVMRGREATTDLEVTEYIENHTVRLVSDSGGTTWDTVFRVRDVGGSTELLIPMTVEPHTLMAKLVTPLVKGMVGKAVEADMDAIKAYCESDDIRR